MSVLRSSSRGDLYVELAVETPVHLTKRQKELLVEFSEEAAKHKTHPESEGFLKKLRIFWVRLPARTARSWRTLSSFHATRLAMPCQTVCGFSPQALNTIATTRST